ncbi:uncharacterized protein ANIA_11416 [Aspergillus nidulans FGSC A4]|uniref:Uncharacterized protein n=1 Tax=Emericella nidulans (strain FGSC A4 / ATCC 38163 / CBS 112.46 / NRRL 194 / M139) TaxID=227321 RepID=C8V707_EMENI|nr:hypothetical protein [Aspergillus nidulans FGSC A4]CBF75388.1 TPA: hypothetical protein ANIA_11416 [Aspergillus nidulans FGSC A4]
MEKAFCLASLLAPVMLEDVFVITDGVSKVASASADQEPP